MAKLAEVLVSPLPLWAAVGLGALAFGVGWAAGRRGER
jgi:hypothetical protein